VALLVEGYPLTVAGAAAALRALHDEGARTAFPFDPLREPPPQILEMNLPAVKWLYVNGLQYALLLTLSYSMCRLTPIAERSPGSAGEGAGERATETDVGPYAQIQWKPVPWLKLTGAERYDQFYYNVTDSLAPSPRRLHGRAGPSCTICSFVDHIILAAHAAVGGRGCDGGPRCRTGG
jgi:hypothetical protein